MFPPRNRSAMLGQKAGGKNPASSSSSLVRPYDPTIQADELQAFQDQQRRRGNIIPMPDAIDLASQTVASQSRIQCNYTPFPFVGTLPGSSGDSQILIPRNNNRSNFYVINLSTNMIFMSFGPHTPNLPGIPVPSGQFFTESNGVIGIDDIYINAGGGGPLVNAKVLGYEGVPTITTPSG